MSMSLETAVESYVRARNLSPGTCDEYFATLRKWKRWGGGGPIEKLTRHQIRDFLDWAYQNAVNDDGTNPGRTANKARENLRAVMSWAWEQDIIERLPRFPKPRPQRDVAGRYYLTKSELNALYFATYRLPRPRGWKHTIPVGRYWRTALVLFFNYGVDTGTIWRSDPAHEPILWRHISWDQRSPDAQTKEHSRWGWLFYRRVKTDKTFYRPMNRVVHAHARRVYCGHVFSFGAENHFGAERNNQPLAAHIKSIMPETPDPNGEVFAGGGSRPNHRFRQLCDLAGLRRRRNVETGCEENWQLKDLRKTCATYYDAHVPESSVEILGHSVGGITYRHYAHRDPLAFKAIMTIPQPSAFMSLIRGHDGECPCCRRPFLVEP